LQLGHVDAGTQAADGLGDLGELLVHLVVAAGRLAQDLEIAALAVGNHVDAHAAGVRLGVRGGVGGLVGVEALGLGDGVALDIAEHLVQQVELCHWGLSYVEAPLVRLAALAR
jgi:hypothetical protein